MPYDPLWIMFPDDFQSVVKTLLSTMEHRGTKGSSRHRGYHNNDSRSDVPQVEQYWRHGSRDMERMGRFEHEGLVSWTSEMLL